MVGGEGWGREGACCVSSLDFFIDSHGDFLWIGSGRFVIASEDGVQDPVETYIKPMAQACQYIID